MFGLAAASPATATPPAWPPPAEELSLDPAAHFGVLPNGLRYVIRPQAVPTGSVSLRLLVLAGSLHEEPGEAGAAHFVEHMAFNGTRHFPGETLGATLERAGIRFGPEVTAFTWPSHTVYHVDLSAHDQSRLELGFRVLRDWADGLVFEPRQIKRERGVVLSELQARGELGARIQLARERFVYAGSRPGRWLVGADRPAVQTIDRERLVGFYRRWYRPDNVIVLVTGDIEPAAAAALVAHAFADFAPAGPAPSAPDPGPIGNPPGLAVRWHPERDVFTFNAEIVWLRAPRPADSAATRRVDLAQAVAMHALGNRLEALRRADPTRYGSLGARLHAPTPHATELSFFVEGRAVDWRDLLTNLATEMNRLRRHGVLESELQEARADLRSSFELGVQHAPTESAVTLADRWAAQLVWAQALTTPAFNRDLALAQLDQLTPADCAAALDALWGHGGPRVFAFGQIDTIAPEQQIETLLDEVLARSPDAPTEGSAVVWAYDDFGPPGAVIARTHHPELDLHLITFANGLRLNLKATPFDAGSAFLSLRLDSGGGLIEPPGQAGLAALAEAALLPGGVGRHDGDGLRRALVGRQVSLNFSVEEDSFLFRGGASRGDLGLLLRILGAYLTDAALRPEAIAGAKESLLSMIDSGYRTPEAALGGHAWRVLAGGHPHYGAPDAAGLQPRTGDEVARWIRPLLAAAPLELGIVGDIDIEETISLVAASLGALPRRGAALPTPDVPFRQTASAVTLPLFSHEPRGGLQIAWPVRLQSPRERRQLELLSLALQTALNERIREDLGMTYVPSTTYWTSRVQPEQAYLVATIVADRRNLKKITRSVESLTKTWHRRGLSAESLERARQPALQQLNAQRESNSYWLHYVLECAQSRPEQLTWPATREPDLRTISLAEINGLARRVLDPRRLIVVTASPVDPR